MIASPMIDARCGHFLLLETSPIRIPAIKRAVPNVLPRALVDLAGQPEPTSPRSELSTADFLITPAECALARTAKVTPLEYALAEKPGGGGIVLRRKSWRRRRGIMWEFPFSTTPDSAASASTTFHLRRPATAPVVSSALDSRDWTGHNSCVMNTCARMGRGSP